jgi:hypothetical protein
MSRRKSQGSRGVVKTAMILTLLPIPRKLLSNALLSHRDIREVAKRLLLLLHLHLLLPLPL